MINQFENTNDETFYMHIIFTLNTAIFFTADSKMHKIYQHNKLYNCLFAVNIVTQFENKWYFTWYTSQYNTAYSARNYSTLVPK